MPPSLLSQKLLHASASGANGISSPSTPAALTGLARPPRRRGSTRRLRRDAILTGAGRYLQTFIQTQRTQKRRKSVSTQHPLRKVKEVIKMTALAFPRIICSHSTGQNGSSVSEGKQSSTVFEFTA
ncbi:uncharacterized protein V6R79_022426 [Siganus canaliculatus]